MFFRDVIGQEEAKYRLIQEVSEGRIPHAQLFCGPEGVGKFPLALAYARYLSCTNRSDTDACGVCPSCVKFNKLVHPDVHFFQGMGNILIPERSSGQISIQPSHLSFIKLCIRRIFLLDRPA